MANLLEIKRTSITRLKLRSAPHLWMRALGLKSKEPRLRDWNLQVDGVSVVSLSLEIKRTSITRLKQLQLAFQGFYPRLEIKRTSITRLKLDRIRISDQTNLGLKSKEPRLRDWNERLGRFDGQGCCTWNQKNLDYEIETEHREHRTLRRWPWNQKNLDYEIETINVIHVCVHPLRLEIKRTSITRLKRMLRFYTRDACSVLKSKEPRLRDWNVDYDRTAPMHAKGETWNQKNLDYEIETPLRR